MGTIPKEPAITGLACNFFFRYSFGLELSRIGPRSALAFRSAAVDIAGLDLEKGFVPELRQKLTDLGLEFRLNQSRS